MKSLRNVFGVLAVLTALFFFAACGGNANNAEQNANGEDTEHMEHMDGEHADHMEGEHADHMDSAEAKEVSEVYFCPMKCEGEKTYDEAGKCPVCGMDLKVKES